MQSAGLVASRNAGKPTRSFTTGNTFATTFSKAAGFILDWLGNGIRTRTRSAPGPGYREEHRPSAPGDGHRP